MFLYLHDHIGDECTIVDTCVIGEDLIHGFINDKFILYGLNIRSRSGKFVKSLLHVDLVPHMTILNFNRGESPEILGSRNGSDITVTGLIEMIDSSNQFENSPGSTSNPARSY